MDNRDRTILKKIFSECEIVQDLLAGFGKDARSLSQPTWNLVNTAVGPIGLKAPITPIPV